jgi:hypothetical protein
MPNDLQAPNWNEAKRLDPTDLANQVSARLETMAKEHNANPSKFMSKLKSGGDMLGLGEAASGPSGQKPEDKGVSQSSFLLMGKGRNKKDVRWEQLKSDSNAMGLPKTYSEKKIDSRILNGGRAKKNHDPFSGGGDRALLEQARIARQSLGCEGGYVSPQGIKCNSHLAMQLGGGELYATMLDAFRENEKPSELRALNAATDGNDKMKEAAKQVGAEVKEEFVKKVEDKQVRTLLAMAPPAPNSPSNGLMGEKA